MPMSERSSMGKHLTNTVDIVSIQYSYKMADPIGELNTVLAMCGIDDAVMHTNIINQEEGFRQ
jgi:hypothetical protein